MPMAMWRDCEPRTSLRRLRHQARKHGQFRGGDQRFTGDTVDAVDEPRARVTAEEVEETGTGWRRG